MATCVLKKEGQQSVLMRTKNFRKRRSRNYFLYNSRDTLRVIDKILQIQYGTSDLGEISNTLEVNVIRIYSRTNVLAEMIGSLQGIEHKEAQKMITACIPKDIFRTLHLGLLIHGREICRKIYPLCLKCVISKFCDYYRKRVLQESQKSPFKIVDLFSGIGGISYGFHKEGFDILLAVDNDPVAMHTYLLNNPWFDEEKFICKDIALIEEHEIVKKIGNVKTHVLVAGVPCQGFSRVGYKTKPKLKKHNLPEKDPRNRLFMEVIRFVDLLQPELVLIENVPDMKNTRLYYADLKGEVIELIAEKLRKRGYHPKTICLDAAKFGIPQKRKRLFFIASRVSFHKDITEEQLLQIAKEVGYDENPRTIANAIDDLPSLRSGEGDAICRMPFGGKTNGFYEDFVTNETSILYNHVSRNHNKDDLRIISALREGETYAKLLERTPEVIKGRVHVVYNTKNFKDKFYRLNHDRSSRTIVSHLAKDGNSFIHPRDNRSLTVREAARIQTFPDDFIFVGARTHQFIHIGNAVPPLLARIIARFFKKHLGG